MRFRIVADRVERNVLRAAAPALSFRRRPVSSTMVLLRLVGSARACRREAMRDEVRTESFGARRGVVETFASAISYWVSVTIALGENATMEITFCD